MGKIWGLWNEEVLAVENRGSEAIKAAVVSQLKGGEGMKGRVEGLLIPYPDFC